MEAVGRGRGGEKRKPPFPCPFSYFFALAPIFARSKSEKCFKPAESPTKTLAAQATKVAAFAILLDSIHVVDCLCGKSRL